ncbi:regulator of G-protein signaling 12 [Notechis scutatus]|uniref:Regulator of G-protein signaling 12 n=1 Tax=Notechis scutatus TaxID=8663 RepID=A0A6J1VLT6_9SAUR|nr:regulator of G-protein signaling 12 [Notechis scutatus]
MYRLGEKPKRRLRAHSSSIRNVEIARGRAGYGFTLSGQAPCVLNSVLKGSPADYVGLKAGDKIFAINEINVKRASHEDVVKLIGKCSGVLHMVIAEGFGHAEACSSEEEEGLYDGKGWPKTMLDLKGPGINRAVKVVEEMQSGEIFNMIFENSNIGPSETQVPKRKEKSVHEGARLETESPLTNDKPHVLYDEQAQTANHNSVFQACPEDQECGGIDASVLNVAMIVGYLGSIELPSSSSNLEYDSLQAIRGCMRRLRAEQRIHSLVALRIMHNAVQLCTNLSIVIATYPAEKLAFSALCPDDKRFFGLVTMQSIEEASLAPEDDAVLRTSCHVFMVDPELFSHKIHQGIARRFGLECTADPDTNGCLEFPLSSFPVLQFVSVLYRDMGDFIDGVRARAFLDGDADAQRNNSMSSNSDSGIGNVNQEEKSRVLVVDLGSNSNKHPLSNLQGSPINRAQNPHWSFGHEQENVGLVPTFQNDKSQNLSTFLASSAHVEVPGPLSKASGQKIPGDHQRWLPAHVLKDWQHGCLSDQESYTDSTDGWSSVNCGTLPPPMSKIPADRYKVSGGFTQPHLLSPKKEPAEKEFQREDRLDSRQGFRSPQEDKKGTKFGPAFGLVQLFHPSSSARRSFGRSKRFSVTRSLEDLESTTVSDGELNHSDLKDGTSDTSLSSNASLPSVQSCQRQRDRRVASWAVSFERLLQDPLGIRYFSDFLRKEFSEENILFWQACDYFNHIPAHDKKEIFNLMKFDSYARFLKSPFYQQCVLAEVEGRPVPDPQWVPNSPTLKSTFGPDMFSVSTPRKLGGKAKSGRSLNEESGEEDGEKKKKGTFFSWSRSKSLGRSQKKKENGNCLKESSQPGELSYRHQSQDSLSSAASLEMGEPCRASGPPTAKEKPPQSCHIHLPDGSTSVMPVRGGASIKEVLSGFCERQRISMAAVDLFLIGGDKPLVLHQDSSILDSQTLRLEKRTLFRKTLRSLYYWTFMLGSQGEGEGRPVGKHNSFKLKGEPGKNSREAHLAPKEARLAQTEKNTRQHLNLEEAEEFFELVSKVQSNRADDQRGLLRKEDLILPDFLQMPPCLAGISTSIPWEPPGPSSRTPHPDGQEESSPEDRSCLQPPSDSVAGQRGPEKALGLPVALGQVASEGTVPATCPRPPNLLLQGNPRWKEEVETMEEEDVIVADLSLVPKGDIGSPPSCRLTLSEMGSPTESKMASEKFRPGPLHKPRTHPQGSEGSLEDPTFPNPRRDVYPAEIRKEIGRPELPIHGVIDVDSVTTSQGPPWFCPEPESRVLFHGGVSEFRAGQPRRPTRTQRTSNLPASPAAGSEKKEENEGPCKATFV